MLSLCWQRIKPAIFILEVYEDFPPSGWPISHLKGGQPGARLDGMDHQGGPLSVLCCANRIAYRCFTVTSSPLLFFSPTCTHSSPSIALFSFMRWGNATQRNAKEQRRKKKK